MNTNERYLIINADDFGMCHSTNQAIMKMYQDQVITSSSIMTVCPWYEEAAEFLRENQHLDVGIHLTFTSEWDLYKWGPINHNSTSSLMDEKGYFYNNCLDFEKTSTSDDVISEIKAQLHKAQQSDIILNNIDNHMGSLYGIMTGKSYLPEVLTISSELNLGFRFPKNMSEARKKSVSPKMLNAMDAICHLAIEKSVPLIDYLVEYPFQLTENETYTSFKDSVINQLKDLKPGVSELYIHPSVESQEIMSINPSWKKRVMEYRLFYEDKLWNTIDREGIKVIKWNDLAQLQR